MLTNIDGSCLMPYDYLMVKLVRNSKTSLINIYIYIYIYIYICVCTHVYVSHSYIRSYKNLYSLLQNSDVDWNFFVSLH